MKVALVLALVFLCGLAKGDTENEFRDSLDYSLARDGENPDPDKPETIDPVTDGKETIDPDDQDQVVTESTDEDNKKPSDPDPDATTVPPVKEDKCKDITCENGMLCEDGICQCEEGLSGDKCDKVDACESSKVTCDDGKKCIYDKNREDKATCECEDGKKFDGKVCKKTCDDAVDAKKCYFDAPCTLGDGYKFCDCPNGVSGDMCETVTDCQEPSGKFKKCIAAEGNCTFDGTSSVCKCKDNKEFDTESEACRETCDDDDDAKKCAFKTQCTPGEDNSFCDCPPGLTGDKCETVTACKPSGKLENCTAPEGECTFDGTKSVCKCKDNNKEFDTKLGVCRETCGDTDDSKKCAFQASCTLRDGHNFCDCPPGLTGDKCATVTDCEPSGKFGKCIEPQGECTFEGTKSVCKCKDKNKKFDTKLGVCRDTCDDNVADKQCANEAKCIVKDGLGLCNCTKGLTGDRCQDITACQTGGTLASCNSGGGRCTYTGGRAFCNCGPGKQFHEKTNKCRTICDPKNSQCKNEAKCEGQDGMTFCTCAEGLTGDLCEVITACEPKGELEKCGSGGGTCKFSAGKASCDCGKGKLFDITDGKCKAACGSVICRNGAQCKDNECQCPEGTSEQDCRMVDGCTKELEEICKKIPSKCVYDTRREAKATCECDKVNVKFDGETCKDCTCGKNEECFFNEEKEKQCPCIEKFAKNNTICEKCDCGAFGTSCSFSEDGKKVCDCEDNYKDNLGTCDVCDCGESGTCNFDDSGSKNCKCEKNFAVKNGTCVECNCGEDDEVASCEFVKGLKVCKCKPSYEDNNGTCTKCVCGDEAEAKGCKFVNGEKKCDCVDMFAQDEGTCIACECGKDTSTGCEFQNGEKKCKCKPKNSQKGEECEACDCGAYGKCAFDENHDKKCNCTKKYEENKEGKCAKCYCGEKGNCFFNDENQKECKCNKGYAEDKGECQKCDCGDFGVCTLVNNKKNCSCNDGYTEKGGKCIKTCTKDGKDCKHKTECIGSEEKGFFCDCQNIFTGDLCEKVTECETGDLKQCGKTGGTCTYDEDKTKADCDCGEGKKLDISLDPKICRQKCEKNGDCKNGGTCKENLCKCNKGTSGDYCSIVDGCDKALKEKCEKNEANCYYDPTATNQATCKCNNADMKYKDETCKPKWCDTDPCKSGSTCDYRNGSAYCNCKNKDQYYNYATESCIDIDKCLLKTCGENEICKNGNCVCGENYEKNDKECIPKKLCSSNPCYSKADCKEGGAGIVKCECPDNTYFKAANSACEDGTCSLPDKRENCNDTCPDTGLNRENGKCVPKEDKYKCTEEKDCGPFGYCVKKNGNSTCVCIKGIATLDKAGVCVLDKKVCASEMIQKDDPNKCDCSGMFKVSTNGITCEPLKCGDKKAQDDCKEKRGFCVEVKNNKKQRYECNCPFGQKLVLGKGCIDVCSDKEAQDKCSKNQQTCYVNEEGKATCKCPPGFTSETNAANQKPTCQPSAQFAYLLKQLPVVSNEFVDKDNSVNKAKLNEYVIRSMQAVYKNYEFASVQSYRLLDGVILCDVWINFNANAETEIKRWRSQIVETDKGSILPPSLFLIPDKLDKVISEKLDFCSDTVREKACGKGTTCDESGKAKACNCMDGYKAIPPTVQVIGDNTVMRCEDIDECLEKSHNCKNTSECVNTPGSFSCKCKPGFHKKDQNESEECVELCSPNPCNNGDCQVKENKVECSCQVGYKGSYCTESDDKLKQAQHSTKVVGAVLGTLLAVTFVAIIAYIVKLKKNSYSEDFSPSPRDNSEMAERPQRGISNRGYQ